MPKFHLRSWAEQTLFDCEDYTVEADTLEDAVDLLETLQEQADDDGIEAGQSPAHPAVEAWGTGDDDRVSSLDPTEIVEGGGGITLIDEDGKRLRDLVGVPSGCPKLGISLHEEALRDATEPQLDPTALLLDDLDSDVRIALGHLALGHLDQARSTLQAMAESIREQLAAAA